jgi:hypothetical protein
MNVFFDLPNKSRGMGRVVDNLDKYIPASLTRVSDPDEADLTVIHVNGRHDHRTIQARKITESGRKYAVIQYVLQSCRNPNPLDWLELWGGAVCMWSYYDLREYCPGMYLAPLAAAPDVFHTESVNKEYLVGTLGRDYKKECVGETRLAAFKLGRTVHIGPEFIKDPNNDTFQNLTDDQVRNVYNQCQWFSVLRREDGFEMPGLEAALCGVRPIMFDTPNYRQWYDGIAEFIPEDNPSKVVGSLKNLLAHEPRPVTDAEIAEIKTRFDWKQIAEEFWNRCQN